jgi:TRIAP1/MDM35 family protein
MSHSLAPECTSLKHAYDSCFNSWFAGYLQPQPNSGDGVVDRQKQMEAQVKDYEVKCGIVWEEYKDCLLVRQSLLFLL